MTASYSIYCNYFRHTLQNTYMHSDGIGMNFPIYKKTESLFLYCVNDNIYILCNNIYSSTACMPFPVLPKMKLKKILNQKYSKLLFTDLHGVILCSKLICVLLFQQGASAEIISWVLVECVTESNTLTVTYNAQDL